MMVERALWRARRMLLHPLLFLAATMPSRAAGHLCGRAGGWSTNVNGEDGFDGTTASGGHERDTAALCQARGCEHVRGECHYRGTADTDTPITTVSLRREGAAACLCGIAGPPQATS